MGSRMGIGVVDRAISSGLAVVTVTYPIMASNCTESGKSK
jgi:hypothetical protein